MLDEVAAGHALKFFMRTLPHGAASAATGCRDDAFERCIVLAGHWAHQNELVRENLVTGKDSRS